MNSILDGVSTLAIVCSQWGDTAKGKLVDYFSEWAEVVARGTGGANAGHTVWIGGKKYIFHLVPSGILRSHVANIIGSGVVLEPKTFLDELDVLKGEGISCENLHIAHNAKLVLPAHIALDRIRESKPGKIGTTGRGIGPSYEDHYRRIGLVVNDLLNPRVFEAKLKRNLEDKVISLQGYDHALVREVMESPALGSGALYHDKDVFDVGTIRKLYLSYGERLAPFITDTDTLLRSWIGSKKILLEGAQGNMLSVDYGSYPYVTSSDCSVHGLTKGVGLTVADVDKCLMTAKAFYMTRVGEGSFPTEMGGPRSALWCGTKGMCRAAEEREFPFTSLDPAGPEFEFGIAVRQVGREYGATTARPRRVGWFDLPLLRYSLGINRSSKQELALTKLDVLDNCPEIKVCTAYCYQGPDYQINRRTLRAGDLMDVAIPHDEVLQHCRPVYTAFKGWMSSTSHLKAWSELPPPLSYLVNFVRGSTGVKVSLLSVGPSREQTIVG